MYTTQIERIANILGQIDPLLNVERGDETLLVPDFGFAPDGTRTEQFGEINAVASITGTGDVDVVYRSIDGMTYESLPPAIRSSLTDPFAVFEEEIKDAGHTISALEILFDRFFLPERNWMLGEWREHYAEHPLFGNLAKRLIWHFAHIDRKLSGIWDEKSGGFVDSSGQLVTDLSDDSLMRLWHPIGYSGAEIDQWKAFLLERKITQPFAQAHRPVFHRTEDEGDSAESTARFADHYLSVSLAVPLAALRKWRFEVYGNGSAALVKPLPELGIDIVWELSEVTTTEVVDVIETGEVRFLLTSSSESLPLGSITPLVFSEAMREVGTFIDTASIRRLPLPSGSLDQPWEDYWNASILSPLSALAQTRKAVLETVLQRSIDGDFLTVPGGSGPFFIHVGAGQVYLGPERLPCPLPAERLEGIKTGYFPFEGDDLLIDILRKESYLANT